MKKLIILLISLLTVFTASCSAAPESITAVPPAEAYIDSGSLVIEYEKGMSDTAVAAYYNGQTLCGAYISQNNGEIYTFGIPKGYTKIRVWFTDDDEIRDVHIIDRTGAAASPSPSPSATPSSQPTEMPSAQPEDEPTEEYDEGYGGFLEQPPADNKNVQTFTFSVECHNALASSKLSDAMRSFLPSDGFIAPAMEYELTEGMTVYDALRAAADKCGFALEHRAGYVSGIGGLREFDCGGTSGWMYLVNGEVIMSPMDGYTINNGDEVRIAYTCSLGDDLGNGVE